MKQTMMLVMIFSVFMLVSCESTLYKKIYKFDDLEMSNNQDYSFEFESESDTESYDVIFMFRYARGFQFNQVVFDFTYIPEFADSISTSLGIPVMTKKGKYLGDGSGDIFDIEQVLFSGVKLAKGKHTIRIKHAMPTEKLQMVMAIGVKVVQNKN